LHELTKLVDDIGPEMVNYLYDPLTRLKAVLVMDTTAFGPTIGGVRMRQDITTEEIVSLARAMTYKMSIFNFPMGGAKAGIWANPTLRGPRRKAMLRAFGKALKPFLAQDTYISGPDMGTYAEDFPIIYEAAGLQYVAGGILQKEKDQEPLENHLTGYGVVASAEIACKCAGLDLVNATVAIEGFGKVGGGVARYMAKSGAKVTAISTIDGAIFNENGLDVGRLLEMRKKFGDKVVLGYEDAKHISKEDLLYLPVDILVPCAGPYVINESNVDRVQARVIVSGANIPITQEAEEILFKKGVIALPDFICNAGGVICGMIGMVGGTEEQAFACVKKLIESTTKEILETAFKEKINPRKLAVRKAREKVLKAQAEKKILPMSSIIKYLEKRLKL